jgi:hypothetical protein
MANTDVRHCSLLPVHIFPIMQHLIYNYFRSNMSIILTSPILNPLGAFGHFTAYPGVQDFVTTVDYIPLPVLLYDHVNKPNTIPKQRKNRRTMVIISDCLS